MYACIRALTICAFSYAFSYARNACMHVRTCMYVYFHVHSLYTLYTNTVQLRRGAAASCAPRKK